jgi:hypothetical protein
MLGAIMGAVGAGSGILGSLFGGGGTKQRTWDESLAAAGKDGQTGQLWDAANADRKRILGQGMDQFGRQGQMSLANMYMQQAAGQGPSLAALQAQQTLQQGAQQQAAMAAGVSPGQQMLARRNAAQNMANMAGSTAGAAAQGRAQEMLGAQAAAAGLYGNMIAQQQAQQGMMNNSLAQNYGNMLGAYDARNNMARAYMAPEQKEQNWFGKAMGGLSGGVGSMFGAGMFSGGDKK